MVRTERLAATADRSGMLEQPPDSPGEVTPEDAQVPSSRFDPVSRRLVRDTVEYWKSAPYPLSFMDGYDVKRRLQDAASGSTATADIAHALAAGDGLLDPRAAGPVRRTRSGQRPPPNDRGRRPGERCLATPVDARLTPVLRAPRSTSRRRRSGRLTKRLIFSSWTVVPQAVASVLSYEAERRMMASPGIRTPPSSGRRCGRCSSSAGDGRPGDEHLRAGLPERGPGAADGPPRAYGRPPGRGDTKVTRDPNVGPCAGANSKGASPFRAVSTEGRRHR